MNALRRVGQHVGRRGAYLLFLFLLDETVAYSLTQPLPLGISRHLAYQPFTDLAPLPVWMWAWALTGLLVLAGALLPRVQWVAFPFAALIKTAWAAGYLVGWLSGYVLYSRGYQTAGIFMAFAAVTLIVSGWRENGT